MKFGFSQSQLLAFIVGIFLIYNTMSIAVVQRRREIGILRSLGTTPAEMRNLFLLEAVLLGAVGSGAGVFAGYWVARILLPVMEQILQTFLMRTSVEHLALTGESIVLGFLAGLLFAFVATLIPAVQAGKVTPMVVLRKDTATRATRFTSDG